MEIIAIIPARGGSKGILRKNIKEIVGKPLISYSIESAIKSEYVDKVIVSTDDSEIAKVSIEYGADVIKRPEHLAEDNSLTIDTIIHSLDYFEEEYCVPDIVILLQPTSPLRKTYDIDNSLKLFMENECNSVISVCKIEHSPYWSLEIEENYLKPKFGQKYFKMRRQELPKLYMPNGAIFISTPKNLKNYKTFYLDKTLPYLMPIERSVDIDTELDFKLAELILSEKNERK